MSISSKLIETKDYSTGRETEQRKRHQIRDEDNTPVLNVDTINAERYASHWYTDVCLNDFQELIETNYADERAVESKGVYRSSEEELGEKLVSTFERILEHDRHPKDCVYLEFRYGPHTLSWNEREEDATNKISLSVRDNDIEPLQRYFETTTSLSQNESHDVIDRAVEDIQDDIP